MKSKEVYKRLWTSLLFCDEKDAKYVIIKIKSNPNGKEKYKEIPTRGILIGI